MTLIVPYVFLSGTARLDGEPAGEPVEGIRTVLADTRLRLAVNLLGGPALAPADFARYQQRRNLGVNRWGLKPEVGYTNASTTEWFKTEGRHTIYVGERPIELPKLKHTVRLRPEFRDDAGQ